MPDRVYDSRTIANYLIGKAAPRGGLDPLQVMKLCYIAHGFTLGLTGRPLIEDDVEAWKLGPVVRRVYDHIPGGSTAIIAPPASFPKIADLENDERGVVDDVFAKYGQFGGLYLSSLTHRPGSPWELTWRTYGRNAVIPKALIQKHYEKVVADSKSAAEQKRPYFATVL